MKKILYINILFILLLSSCGQKSQEIEKKTKANNAREQKAYAEALRIAVLPTLDCIPLYVAKDRHLFDSVQVDVRLLSFTAQMDCDTAIIGGSVQGVVSDLVRTERLKRKGLKLEYPITTPLQWQLISNKTARLKQLNQLGDKMVAMTRYSGTDYLTDQALSGVKTSAKVFKVQINDVLVRLHMLLNNEMDAMWLPEPQATTARLYKHRVITQSEKTKEQLGVIAFRTDMLQTKNRKKQLQAFIKAYNNAVDSLNTYGLSHYSELVTKYCHTDEKTVKAIPKVTFKHATAPLEKDIQKAKAFIPKL